MGKLFGTDGIRGVANRELTPELAFKMGRIVAALLRDNYAGEADRSFFVVGRDTRISGTMLESALVAGITSSGLGIHLLGVVPTPAVAYLTASMGAVGGVMVSASHNPVSDNGIKFFDAKGHKLDDRLEQQAESHYFQDNNNFPRPEGELVGTAIPSLDSVARYANYLKTKISHLEGLRVVLDCANGSLYHIAPQLYRELGAEVVATASSPDGININQECGSTNPGKLQQDVLDHRAQVGLAFDGDGDRLIAVDEQGQIMDGDAIMAVCAAHLKEQDRLKDDTLVATVMSNGGLDIVGEEYGFQVLRTKVGDRYVLEEMLRGGYILGGEQSGHIIFSDVLPTGDGLLTSLQLLKVMQDKGQALSSLASILRRLPQKLVNCRVKTKEGWEENQRIQEALQNAEEKLGTRGRVLVRASGTEPLIRIMVEGEDNALLEELCQQLFDIVQQELGGPGAN